MQNKERLDCALVSRGLVSSREKAKALIMSGVVFVNNQKFDKAGDTVKPDDNIEVRGETLKYVSRGGLKLEKAMKSFDLKLDGFVCADIGASTGGFTDCMLQNGAVKVYSVDVGYGQLAWKLRTDSRVVNLERTNFRYVTKEQIPENLDFASVDVSFISLSLILPALRPLLKDGGKAVCLIKPQFEAGKENVGKKGVVRDKNVHLAVIEKIINLISENKFSLLGLDFSPIKGPEGNIEYLCFIEKRKNHLWKKNFSLFGLDFSPIKGPEGNIEYLCFIEKSDCAENLCKTTVNEVVEASYNALKEENYGSSGNSQS